VGREVQIYSSDSNDNTYTHGFQPPYDGFKNLLETVNHTESPIRLKPFNIYYHMFAGQHQASIEAVRGNLEAARAAHITPIEASRYAAIAHGFYNAEMTQLAPNQWRIAKRGALQTIRFDHADALAVDFANSRGVIGQMHYQGSLYIALDEAVEPVMISVQNATSKAVDPTPYLIDSRWRVWNVTQHSGAIRFTAQGFGKGEMTWHVPADGTYTITARSQNGTLLTSINTAASQENLTFMLNISAIALINISLASQTR
jgi:hypothetical protein